MRREPCYSIILYYCELFEENIEFIIDNISKGIVVHLFLFNTLKDDLELNEYEKDTFSYAIGKLLFIYEGQHLLGDDNAVIAIDGDVINSNLYNKIRCKESNFNFQQYEIITSKEDGNYIVSSGAGTGKTTTMINRLIFLKKSNNNFNFNNAVLITFTNKASIAMREKLIEKLEMYYKITRDSIYLDYMDEALSCSIMTIHKFAKKIINDNGKYININKDVKVKSYKYERKLAISKGLNFVFQNHKELYTLIKYYPIYDVEDKLLKVWDKLDNYSLDINSTRYEVKFGEDDISKLVDITLRKAQEYLDEYKDYDIEIVDLMKKLYYKELFTEIKTNKKYQYIMVDEFQDSDNIQIDFITNFISITGARALVVGDEKQSIYRFRGAEYTAFNLFCDKLNSKHIPYKKYSMVRNYRTNSKLLSEINNIFIKLNDDVKKFVYEEEDYIYSKEEEEKETSIEYIDLSEEGSDKNFYNSLLDKKEKDAVVAVLFRSNNDLKDFKEYCDKNSILCRVDVTGGFYRHESVRDFYVMIRALMNLQDNNIIYSFIETPYINKNINKEVILESDFAEIKSYLQQILLDSGWKEYSKKLRYTNILELVDEIIEDLDPIKNYYCREYNKARKVSNNYKNIAYMKTLDYKNNLEYLIYILKENFSDNISSIYAIEEFIRIKMSTDTKEDVRRLEDSDEKNFLQCLTVHKAKGMEYDYVVLPKLTNSFNINKSVDVILRSRGKCENIGLKLRFGDEEHKNLYYKEYIKDEKEEIIGEETRLLYVAMTRCKKGLYINASKLIGTEGQNNWKTLLGGARDYV